MADSRLYPSGKAGFYTKFVRGVLNYYRKSDGVQFASVDGANFGFNGRKQVNAAAATQTLTAAQTGQHFLAAVDAVFTLPAASSSTKGVYYTFECGALSAGTGLSISPVAADAIGGNGLSVTIDKDLINSGASDRLGDMVTIYCTGAAGTTAWRVTNIIGTWAKEA